MAILKGTHKLPKQMWAGFVCGRIDLDPYDDVGDGKPSYGRLYLKRADARRRYEDVRRVEVCEVRRTRSTAKT